MAMARQPRDLRSGYCYHITTRCNNREFRLTRGECRDFLLYAINRCQQKHGFTLHALCIMSNHVHYLLAPKEPHDLPRIMQWLNGFTAMGFKHCIL